ncbi:MAG: dCTP deaminase [Thermoplasmatota archaeon]
MPIWSDADLAAAVADGSFGVEPWLPDDLTPNGLDLRIGEVLVPGHHDDHAVTEGTVVVPPMSRFLVGTEQVVAMPAAACGQLWLRSSYARRGVLASFGKVEAGFAGNLTLAAFNSAAEPLEIPVGDRFCQLILEDLRSAPAEGYEARSGTYQHQRGVTLAKDRA